jgi:predicted DCC family thiol-disulfide oxidoreductase YuxK
MNTDTPAQPEVLVLFDGQCNLCAGSVQYLIPRDHAARLMFASLQSPRGQHLRDRFGVETTVDSMVAIADGQAFVYSDAVIRIAKALGGRYRVGAYIGRLLPRPVRDAGYRFVARNRYRWFGHRPNKCWLPTPELRARFAADGLS